MSCRSNEGRRNFQFATEKLKRWPLKSSGKFAIFSYLNFEGGGGQRHITEKLQLKI